MATLPQLLQLFLLITVLSDTVSPKRIKSSVDFHFGIVKSKPRTLRTGKRQKEDLKKKKKFLKGTYNETMDEEYEKSRPRDCRVVLNCKHVKKSPYRTADGSCNNLNKPDWGSAFQPYRRILRPKYDDRMSVPRIRSSKTGELLPSPREISRVFHSSDSEVTEHQDITHMVMQWGQFLDHDISFTPIQAKLAGTDNVTSISCCPDELPGDMPYGLYSIDSFKNCFPIPIPKNDPAYSGKRCMSFSRSVQVRNTRCRVSPVEQVNQITAFIDASMMYGSSEEEMKSLRSMEGGVLTGQIVESKSGCPRSVMLPSKSCKGNECFKTGDVRANEQPGLASMHTIFLREHNRIAGILKGLNGHWNDEILFQETRKILGAMMQVITYTEFLPIILGSAMKKYGLTPKYNLRFSKDPPDPSVTNVFATAAFRFGHSQIRGFSSKCSKSYNSCGNETRLRDLFGNSMSMILNTCFIGDTLRGLGYDKCPRVDRFMSKEVTEHMFEDEDGNSLDLAALNIQRGRDHGLPGYNSWRKECGLRKFNKFSKMSEHSKEEQELLKQLYSHPDDIDLFTAGVSEKPVKGGLVGQTFSCLLARQFKALKRGDRFWYENNRETGSFSTAQLNEIRKVTLSTVICHNTETISMQRNCFKSVDDLNPRQSCKSLINKGMDLTAWRETKSKNPDGKKEKKKKKG